MDDAMTIPTAWREAVARAMARQYWGDDDWETMSPDGISWLPEADAAIRALLPLVVEVVLAKITPVSPRGYQVLSALTKELTDGQ